jgi:hypothetical protein
LPQKPKSAEKSLLIYQEIEKGKTIQDLIDLQIIMEKLEKL